MTLTSVADNLMNGITNLLANGLKGDEATHLLNYKKWMVSFKKQYGQDVLEYLLPPIKLELRSVVYLCVANGCMDMLLWLIDEWKIDKTLRNDPDFTFKILIEKVINGPFNQYFDWEDLGKHSNKLVFSKIFNQFFIDWDGRSDICLFVKSLKIDDDDGLTSYYPLCGSFRDKDGRSDIVHGKVYLNKFVDHFLLKVAGERVQMRIKMLQWLLDERKTAQPDLHTFVTNGQYQLLQWYCNAKYIDIYAPLNSIPSFLNEMVNNNPWFEEISGSAFSGDVSVVETLCVLAAGIGEFATFCWLMREKVKTKGFHVNGMNMLHISAACGYLHISKWLIKMEWISLKKLTLSGMSACHLALKYNHDSLGLYLLEISDLKDLRDSKGLSNYWYASNSTSEGLCQWALDFRKMAGCREMMLLIDKKAEFKEFEMVLDDSGITDHFLNAENFTNIRLDVQYYNKEDYLAYFVDSSQKNWNEYREILESNFSSFFSFVLQSAMSLDFIRWLVGLYERKGYENRLSYENIYGKAYLDHLSEYTHRINQDSFASCVDDVIRLVEEKENRKEDIDNYSWELMRLFTVGASIQIIHEVFTSQNVLIEINLNPKDSFHFTQAQVIFTLFFNSTARKNRHNILYHK